MTFKRLFAFLLAALPVITPAAAAEQPVTAANVQRNLMIPYEMFTLGNGLRVIVHTERKAPVVAVAVWYHVGSKDERPGRTGFAHLFEHLMFNGSENFNDEWMKPLEEVGATGMNGTTWFDRTNYFQTVPTTAVERVLWLESDRMGHLLGAIDQAKLDEQRGVVLNEKKQGDNQPYGQMDYRQLEGLFPEGHPYRWSSIGSEADLNAATLTDVKEWFRDNYGPANAVLVLAGDIDVATARPLAEKYFGAIDPGKPVQRRTAWVPSRPDNTRDVLYDRVPQARLSRSWVAPEYRARDLMMLQLAASIVGGGKTSRLYKALVHDQALASAISLSVQAFEIASISELTVAVRPEVDPRKAEAAMEAVLAEFLRRGPTKAELDRSRIAIRAAFLRGLDRVGGFSGRASALAEGLLYADDPGFYRQELDWLDAATPADVQKAAQRWLGQGWHQVTALPFGKLAPAADAVDRKAGMPAVTTTPDLTFPEPQTATLANGIPVTLVPVPGSPLVELALVFDAGFAADDAGLPGLASLTMDMLDEGAAGRSAVQIAETAEGLGAALRTGAGLDTATIRLSALAERLEPSLALVADLARRPDFRSDDLERLRRNRMTGIAQEKAAPQSLALRLLPPALFGTSHPYGKPMTGSGTEAALAAMQAADLRAFQARWLRPDTARLIVAGGVPMATLLPALNKALGDWTPPASPRGVKPDLAAPARATARLAIVDKPGAPQSFILAGRVSEPGTTDGYFAQAIANEILGGAFTSRINMNLRETKHWSYGADSFFMDALGPRPWIALAQVQTDRTADSVREMIRDIRAFSAGQPATAEETAHHVRSAVRSLPGAYETVAAMLGRVLADTNLNRPANFVTTVKQRYEALTPASVAAIGAPQMRADDLTWVIVGDRERIEAQLRGLNLGAVEIWDENGAKVE